VAQKLELHFRKCIDQHSSFKHLSGTLSLLPSGRLSPVNDAIFHSSFRIIEGETAKEVSNKAHGQRIIEQLARIERVEESCKICDQKILIIEY